MSLTDRERQILELRQKGMTDYAIAKKLGVLMSSIQRSRRNAQRKLAAAKQDFAWAQSLNIEF